MIDAFVNHTALDDRTVHDCRTRWFGTDGITGHWRALRARLAAASVGSLTIPEETVRRTATGNKENENGKKLAHGTISGNGSASVQVKTPDHGLIIFGTIKRPLTGISSEACLCGSRGWHRCGGRMLSRVEPTAEPNSRLRPDWLGPTLASGAAPQSTFE